MASPSPVPSPMPLVVKKGSKIRPRTSSFMPVPVSLTAMQIYPLTPPSKRRSRTLLASTVSVLIESFNADVEERSAHLIWIRQDGWHVPFKIQCHGDGFGKCFDQFAYLQHDVIDIE